MNRDEFEALAKKAELAKHGLGWTAWESQLERFAALVRAEDKALLRQALDALAYWLEHGETPGAHDMIQRTHDVLQERLK